MTTTALTEAGATGAELAIMREAAARVRARQGEPLGEDPFTVLACPFTTPAPGTRSVYSRCCDGAHHFCTAPARDA